MRLSDAIRLGAMLKPQGFDDYEIDGATCAMGAALEAVNAEASVGESQYFPIVRERATCPVCGPTAWEYTCSGTVFHLNDDHRWTREQIADWVETLEARSTAMATASGADSAEILSLGTR